MKTKSKILSFFALFLVVTLQAQKQPTTVSAVINPVAYTMTSSNDEPFTIITWNDASTVTGIEASIWGFDFDMIEGDDYTITPIDGSTSRLTFISAKAKSQSKNDDVVCTINFNVGTPAVFTIISYVEVEYGVQFWVIDSQGNDINDAVLTFDGVTFAPGDYDAGFYTEGIYNYTFVKQGYMMVHGAVTVNGPISQTIVMYPDGNTGIDSPETITVKAYPNPVSVFCNLSFENEELRTIRFYAIDGMLVKEMTSMASHIQANIGHLAAGTYIVKVQSEKGTALIKMIKQS